MRCCQPTRCSPAWAKQAGVVVQPRRREFGTSAREERRHSKWTCDMGASVKPLHIDIPVTLREVKTVFSIGALVFEGDLPASIFHLQLIGNDIGDWNAKSELIAVFHTNAGHATLHDDAYNTEHGTTGADHAPPSPSLSKASPRAESRAAAWSSSRSHTLPGPVMENVM